MEAIDAILTRRSVRKYGGGMVSEADLKTILDCAMHAPSANHGMPWHFIVVRDRASLGEIAETNRWAAMAQQAALAIIVCGDEKLQVEKGFWMLDCSAAAQNILLAAHALGYGAVWTAVYPDEGLIAKVRGLFNMPENAVPLCIVPIGVPAEKIAPEARYDGARIHQDKW
jgi:nitroreductase